MAGKGSTYKIGQETLIGQGRTAEIYKVGHNKIIKLFKTNIPKEAISLEYEINNYVEKRGLPAPKTFELVKIENRLGIVYEHINGDSMFNQILSKPWVITTVAKRLADLHLHVHDFKCQELPSQGNKMKNDISKADLLSQRDKEFIGEYLDGLDDDSTICHGDFHPDNILITTVGPIIIDWLTGSRGNAKADVVRTSLLLTKGSFPPGTPKHKELLLSLIRNIFHFCYLRRYMRRSGISKSELGKWKLPVAAARLSENLPMEEKKQLLQLVENSLVQLRSD